MCASGFLLGRSPPPSEPWAAGGHRRLFDLRRHALADDHEGRPSSPPLLRRHLPGPSGDTPASSGRPVAVRAGVAEVARHPKERKETGPAYALRLTLPHYQSRHCASLGSWIFRVQQRQCELMTPANFTLPAVHRHWREIAEPTVRAPVNTQQEVTETREKGHG